MIIFTHRMRNSNEDINPETSFLSSVRINLTKIGQGVKKIKFITVKLIKARNQNSFDSLLAKQK